MNRRGPLITLGSVVILAVVFLWANTVAGKSANSTATAAGDAAASTAVRCPRDVVRARGPAARSVRRPEQRRPGDRGDRR